MSIIFIGIIVVIAALVSIMLDSKKSRDYNKDLDKKKKELLDIISDADEMIIELNKFSDYIVSQINVKSAELGEISDKYGFEATTKSSGILMDESDEKVNEANDIEYDKKYDKEFDNKENLIENTKVIKADNIKYNKYRDNAKYKQVFELSENGFEAADIAKKMNMGKGEVQLVLELNR